MQVMEDTGGPRAARGHRCLSGAGAASQRAGGSQESQRHGPWKGAGSSLLIPGMEPPYSGQPAQHNFLELASFCCSSWCLPPSPNPPAIISMTHKPNILALSFTHQNKDEKNFVDTVVPLGVLAGHEVAAAFLSPRAGPHVGPCFWSWGSRRLQGPRREVGVDSLPRKGRIGSFHSFVVPTLG